jgi:hypothetical protein
MGVGWALSVPNMYVSCLVVGLACLSVPDIDMNMDSEKCDEDYVCVKYDCIVL